METVLCYLPQYEGMISDTFNLPPLSPPLYWISVMKCLVEMFGKILMTQFSPK